jgi:hypothetical protein
MDDPGGGDCGWGIRAMVNRLSGGWDEMSRLCAESPACKTVSALVGHPDLSWQAVIRVYGSGVTAMQVKDRGRNVNGAM